MQKKLKTDDQGMILRAFRVTPKEYRLIRKAFGLSMDKSILMFCRRLLVAACQERVEIFESKGDAR